MGKRDDQGFLLDPFEPLRERGVAQEVWEARGYVPYYGRHHPLHDPDTVKMGLALYELTPGQKATYTRFTNGARDAQGRDGYGDGLVMPKYPVPGAPPILPQLRPSFAVRTGSKTRHRHDQPFSDVRDLERHLDDEHDGLDCDGWHEHENFAKYLLAPRAKEDVWHDHATDAAFEGPKGSEKLRAHLRSAHRGNDSLGEHKHRRHVPEQHIANRLDMHWRALERLATARIIYFAFEGTPKADAILSYIISHGLLASAFDVPSVTLWHAPELASFAKWALSGWLQEASGGSKPLVVIVCDADHHENDRVVRQALFCRERLRALDVTCCIAAPPDSRDVASGKLLYKGVDDFLAAGGKLDDLVVLDREAPFELGLHTTPDGTICGTTTGFAKLLHKRKDAEVVLDTLQNHISLGLLTTDRVPELERDEWTGHLRWKGKRDEWPTFTVHADWRYTQQFVQLGDYEPQNTQPFYDIFDEEVAKAYVELGFRDTKTWDEALAIHRKASTVAARETARRIGQNDRSVRRRVQTIAARNNAFRQLLIVPATAKEQSMGSVTPIRPLPSDNVLASDADRLRAITEELAGIAVRLQSRFPGAAEGLGVRFLATVAESGQRGRMKTAV